MNVTHPIEVEKVVQNYYHLIITICFYSLQTHSNKYNICWDDYWSTEIRWYIQPSKYLAEDGETCWMGFCACRSVREGGLKCVWVNCGAFSSLIKMIHSQMRSNGSIHIASRLAVEFRKKKSNKCAVPNN